MKRFITVALALSMVLLMSLSAMATTTNPGASVEGIHLNPDVNNEVDNLEGAMLTPGTDYEFPLMVTIGGSGQTITSEILRGYRVDVSYSGGSGLFSTAKFENNNVLLYLRQSYTTKQTAVTLTLKFINRNTSRTEHTVAYSFKVGYETIGDEYVSGLASGDNVVVTPEAPVITKTQFTRISRQNDYRNVTLSHDGWFYRVNVTDMESTNMYSTHSAIREVAQHVDLDNVKFLSFPAQPQFGVSGKLEIDMSDVADDFGDTFYVYRYVNGQLTQIRYEYDIDSELLSFNTNTLGRFVITDEPINNLVINNPENENNNNDNNGVNNPGTGALDFVNVAASLAVLSLAAGSAIVLKKRSN